jgi:threonine dehydrogenase-like Zn-dependent dehydrogenase
MDRGPACSRRPPPGYMRPLLDRSLNREIDPSFVISHQLPLDEAPRAYEMFRDKEDDRTKVVLRP